MLVQLLLELAPGAVLLAFWSALGADPTRAGRLWLWSWFALYVSVLLGTAAELSPVMQPLSLAAGSLHPFLLLAGALAMAGHRVPRSLVPLGAAVAAGRALFALSVGVVPAYLIWVPAVIGLDAASIWVLQRHARRSQASGPERWLPGVVAAYLTLHVVWLLVAPDLRAPVEAGGGEVMIAASWMVTAVGLFGLQMLSIVERARSHARRLLAESRATEEALRRRQAFERLIASLSTGFVRLEPGELEGAIQEALGAIGRFADVDRSYILLFRDDAEHMDIAHEWCAPGIPTQMHALEGHSVEPFATGIERLRRGETVTVVRLADMRSATARRALESWGIRSLAIVPLRLGAETLGAVGFDCVRAERVWSEEEVTLLSMAADLFAHAMARLRAARALHEREEELLQAQKMDAIGRLAGGIAHDFNNLLTAIRGFGDLVLGQLAEDDPVRADVREITAAAERAVNLTSQLLAFGRRQVLAPRAFDLNETVRGLESMLARLIGEHVVLDTRLAPHLGAVRADPAQIELVIVNLVLNARDAMSRGGSVVVSTRSVKWSAAEPRPDGLNAGEWVELSVRDEGCGMAPEVRDRVFEPFFTTKPSGLGTGLGLSVAYGVVRQSGGAIEIESEPGRGTCVRVFLPLAGDEARRVDLRSPAETRGGCVRVNAGTILVVEDEDAVRRLARRFLEGVGHRVFEARDGEEALALASRRHVDVLLTDVVMPRMGGVELASRLRRSQPGIRVLFMSGHPREHRDRIARTPEGLLLEKPFSAQGLRERVDWVLDAPPDRS